MNKFSISRFAGFAAAAVIGLLISSATADAQYRDPYYSGRNNGYNNSSYYGNSANIAVDNGYRLGFGDGSNDRYYGKSFDVDRSKVYRDADSGYSNSGFRDKDDYKRFFRQGYEQGYRNGYQSNNRNNNGYYGNSYPTYYPNNGRGRDREDSCSSGDRRYPQVNQRPGRRRGWDRNHPVFGTRR